MGQYGRPPQALAGLLVNVFYFKTNVFTTMVGWYTVFETQCLFMADLLHLRSAYMTVANMRPHSFISSPPVLSSVNAKATL